LPSWPGEKLADRQKALATSRWRDDEKIAKFPAGGCRADAKHVSEAADAAKQAWLSVGCSGQKLFKLA
jgi:hypothetical protein